MEIIVKMKFSRRAVKYLFFPVIILAADDTEREYPTNV